MMACFRRAKCIIELIGLYPLKIKCRNNIPPTNQAIQNIINGTSIMILITCLYKIPTVRERVSALAQPLLEMKRTSALKALDEMEQTFLISPLVGKS